MSTPEVMSLADLRALAGKIRAEVTKAIIGQDEMVDLLLVAMVSEGHVLLEGPPGTAKTFLAQSFATALGLDFGRIQFTPDLLPGDILGSNLFNFQTSQFTLTRGPIFCELLLADEINRTPPKTQAALLEAMQERRVTLDGETHALSDRFLVLATQNPIENQGVYPLPEAQLDRFLFKLLVPYPGEREEAAIVARYGQRQGPPRPADLGVEAVTDSATLSQISAAVSQVTVAEEIVDYVVRLVRATRDHAELSVGASPRAAVLIANAARARAALDGRDYVIPDDVKALAVPTLRHRLTLSPAAEIEGRDLESLVSELVESTEAPR
ncbi:MoxR-like ATPase in aerotolerance operon [Altererythrobacter epoxidivorans]|uniref:MoxR-like ATPase in aerotolerance operon n=1 Tax=Altererythrobacter epoxidivorans TaxID=361183 RepID=A0A0M5KZX0_9SPHN|nr:MoxR family ATPase [Altererythrobacter epoxidivorans]ALE15607.1 MoxR-like ATPase in aerotolerance operon [Altererythrobacter epoxidivorans]